MKIQKELDGFDNVFEQDFASHGMAGTTKKTHTKRTKKCKENDKRIRAHGRRGDYR